MTIPLIMPLTVDDLERLPEDGHRRELIDGVLHTPPSQDSAHGVLQALLMVALRNTAPDDVCVTQAVDIELGDNLRFTPDLLAITTDAARARQRRYLPNEIILTGEIVSETSQAMDRILKPHLYAAAGIPHYWRIETEGVHIAVHCHTLGPSGGYRETASFEDHVAIAAPWKIDIPIPCFTPGHL